MLSPSELLRSHDAPTRLRAVVPWLELSDGALTSGDVPAGERRAAARPTAPGEAARLRTEGRVELADAVELELRERLVAAVRALVGAGLPAVTVYAFDEVWRIGEALRARVSALLQHDYLLVDDAWAWQVAPGTSGWPPHRGSLELLDRDAPELINLWVALTDVSLELSCMHLVPLEHDPHYPGALERTDFDVEHVLALPVAAGTALGWNANVLHWGGACAPDAPAPRVSCSFTLARGERGRALPLVRPSTMTAAARLDSIALQIATYGRGQPDVTDDVREWALATCALRRIAELAAPSPQRKAP